MLKFILKKKVGSVPIWYNMTHSLRTDILGGTFNMQRTDTLTNLQTDKLTNWQTAKLLNWQTTYFSGRDAGGGVDRCVPGIDHGGRSAGCYHQGLCKCFNICVNFKCAYLSFFSYFYGDLKIMMQFSCLDWLIDENQWQER